MNVQIQKKSMKRFGLILYLKDDMDFFCPFSEFTICSKLGRSLARSLAKKYSMREKYPLTLLKSVDRYVLDRDCY